MLKLYVYGYLNQVQSSRRFDRECARNLELIWLLGRLKALTQFGGDGGLLAHTTFVLILEGATFCLRLKIACSAGQNSGIPLAEVVRHASATE